MTEQKRLTISISQIAPLVGLDAYNNFPRIVCEIWRKYNPINFKLYETKLKEKGYQLATSNEMNDIWEADEALGTNLLQQVKELNSNKDKSSANMVLQQAEITKTINSNEKLTIIQKNELVKKVCSVTTKMHGVINEDSVLAEFCRLSEKTIKQTQGWIEIPCNENGGSDDIIKWLIVGKYDAITTDNELVEAKMRQKCLFKKVRDYENVQVQLYLYGLQFTNAYLVESYTNKKNINQTYVNEIKYDESYVVEVLLERIMKFIKFFETVIMIENETNSILKEELLSSDKNHIVYDIYKKQYLCINDDYMDF